MRENTAVTSLLLLLLLTATEQHLRQDRQGTGRHVPSSACMKQQEQHDHDRVTENTCKPGSVLRMLQKPCSVLAKTNKQEHSKYNML
jgi:hypothetical protein